MVNTNYIKIREYFKSIEKILSYILNLINKGN